VDDVVVSGSEDKDAALRLKARFALTAVKDRQQRPLSTSGFLDPLGVLARSLGGEHLVLRVVGKKCECQGTSRYEA
jgi:hypothetical protein